MRLTRTQLARIKALENKHGQISAQRVLADAKLKTSPLHSLFNWNVKHAAERWWLHRARVIIGSVTLQVVTTESTFKGIAYVVDTTIKGGGYRSVVSMRADPVAAQESLVYTLEIAAGHLRRAFDLAVPLGLEKEIDRLLAEIAGVKRLTAQSNKAA